MIISDSFRLPDIRGIFSLLSIKASRVSKRKDEKKNRKKYNLQFKFGNNTNCQNQCMTEKTVVLEVLLVEDHVDADVGLMVDADEELLVDIAGN